MLARCFEGSRRAVGSVAGVVLMMVLGSSVMAQSTKQGRFVPGSFQLYYGGDSRQIQTMIASLEASALVVVDLRAITALQLGMIRRHVRSHDGKLVGYISVGELNRREWDQFTDFAKQADPAVDLDGVRSRIFLSDNRQFNSMHADVSDRLWRDYVEDRIVDIMASGVDGLFLDTVDTIDIYLNHPDWDADRKIVAVDAMVNWIRQIKLNRPNACVVQNRGLNLIGESVGVPGVAAKRTSGLDLQDFKKGNPDVILYENAFASDDEWTRQVTRQLMQIQSAGHTSVVALGYADHLNDRPSFDRQCDQHGFLPVWADNSYQLHEKLAR